MSQRLLVIALVFAVSACSTSTPASPSPVEPGNKGLQQRVQDIPGFSDPGLCEAPLGWKCALGGLITLTGANVTIVGSYHREQFLADPRVFRSDELIEGPNVVVTAGKFAGSDGVVILNVTGTQASVRLFLAAPSGWFEGSASAPPSFSEVPSSTSPAVCSSQIDLITTFEVVLPHLGKTAISERHCRL
jgi:hypothetical protein